jgi:hypothetical protein
MEHFMPNVHPAILFIVIKNMIMFSLFYFGNTSWNFILWWVTGSAVFYAIAALNIALCITQKLEDEKLAQKNQTRWTTPDARPLSVSWSWFDDLGNFG